MAEGVYDFVVMDSRSRVTIPAKIRKLLGLAEGMKFLMITDTERREIRMIPLVELQAKVYKLRIIMIDTPGVLARIASLLANEKVDLLITESRTIRRGETAEWVIIADLSQCKLSISDLISRIKGVDLVKKVEITEIK
ncbi:MAG: AbrB family transcriptional regulator [Thermoproteota archaeon]|mgnify:CR=1 FL=1|nr:ACT domain-containing protein [Candidatus Korarchaeota archaeon]RLG43460.1 MAG: AbrB family transcriptional regulator [Candidatus Korarchaeota archaeon]